MEIEIDGTKFDTNVEVDSDYENDDFRLTVNGEYKCNDAAGKFLANLHNKKFKSPSEKIRCVVKKMGIDTDLEIGAVSFNFYKDSFDFYGEFLTRWDLGL